MLWLFNIVLLFVDFQYLIVHMPLEYYKEGIPCTSQASGDAMVIEVNFVPLDCLLAGAWWGVTWWVEWLCVAVFLVTTKYIKVSLIMVFEFYICGVFICVCVCMLNQVMGSYLVTT